MGTRSLKKNGLEIVAYAISKMAGKRMTLGGVVVDEGELPAWVRVIFTL